ncbi:MAG: hypothetical protein LC109_12445 [Bacteroidia bacterium]|nr:hypothetical protein [Bacteroidia bacterium]
MKKTTFLQSGFVPAKLKTAVINQLGGWESFTNSAQNIASHGIDGGYSGFIYTDETHTFAMRNRKLIVELLEETANQLDVDVVRMVSEFGVFRNSPMDSEDKKDLYKYIGGGRPKQGPITNVMAWFAAEEVAREYAELEYEESN